MNRGNQILWGVILVGIGLLLGMNAMGITSFNLFFDGWWTLFIIIPCAAGLFSGKDITGNLIGLGVGVFLLLCCLDILNFNLLWKLVFPVIVILLGAKLIFGNLLDRNSSEIKRIAASSGAVRYVTAVFSGEKINFSGEVFQSGELNAVFGGVDCDLRNAIIEQDCFIQASAVFGGIDILVPDNINVKVSSNSLFGGISNKKANHLDESIPTLYIKGSCLFGGIDIK